MLSGYLDQISFVSSGLYLSGYQAIKPDRIRSLGITCIVNATVDAPFPSVAGVEAFRVKVEDVPHAQLAPYFETVADKIRQAIYLGGRVLVHCMAGVSRSASLCIVYLMKYHSMTLKQAYLHVKGKRPIIRPNCGFFKQLIEFERRLLGGNSIRMVQSVNGSYPDVYEHEYNSQYRLTQSPLQRFSGGGLSNNYSGYNKGTQSAASYGYSGGRSAPSIRSYRQSSSVFNPSSSLSSGSDYYSRSLPRRASKGDDSQDRLETTYQASFRTPMLRVARKYY